MRTHRSNQESLATARCIANSAPKWCGLAVAASAARRRLELVGECARARGGAVNSAGSLAVPSSLLAGSQSGRYKLCRFESLARRGARQLDKPTDGRRASYASLLAAGKRVHECYTLRSGPRADRTRTLSSTRPLFARLSAPLRVYEGWTIAASAPTTRLLCDSPRVYEGCKKLRPPCHTTLPNLSPSFRH